MIRSFSDYALSQIVGGLPLKFRVEIGANGAEPFKFRTMDGRRWRWPLAGGGEARVASYSGAARRRQRAERYDSGARRRGSPDRRKAPKGGVLFFRAGGKAVPAPRRGNPCGFSPGAA